MFTHGADYLGIFDTPQGPIQVLAVVHIIGTHLVLEDFLYYAKDVPELKIGPKQVRAILRLVRTQAKEQGFKQITMIYHRLGEGRPGNLTSRTRSL